MDPQQTGVGAGGQTPERAKTRVQRVGHCHLGAPRREHKRRRAITNAPSLSATRARRDRPPNRQTRRRDPQVRRLRVVLQGGIAADERRGAKLSKGCCVTARWVEPTADWKWTSGSSGHARHALCRKFNKWVGSLVPYGRAAPDDRRVDQMIALMVAPTEDVSQQHARRHTTHDRDANII